MAQTISFNGLDGSGKTEQIEFLKWRMTGLFHFTRTLSHYSSRWPQLDPMSASKWWFEDVPITELAGMMIEALLERCRDQTPGKIAVWDRGPRMYQAVCAATWATRDEKLHVADLLEIVGRQFQASPLPEKDTEICLDMDPGYRLQLRPLQAILSIRPERPDWMNQRYDRYQGNLRQAIGILYQQKQAARHQNVSDCAVVVSNEIAGYLNEAFSLRITRALDHLELILGLSGYSESGKSSVGELLRLEKGALRLKLRFFSQYLRHFGQEPGPKEVAYEVLRFAQAHPYPFLTIESLHGYRASAYLRLLIGERYRVAFLEADFETRVKRSMALTGQSYEDTARNVRERDSTKSEAGIETVRELSDIRVNNNLDWPAASADLLAQIASITRGRE